MRVTLPHKLSKKDVRERLRSNAHKIADSVPGGMAEVETAWTGDDRLDLTIKAMGQNLTGDIAIEANEVVITLNLPFSLTFVEPMIANTVKEQGLKLLA